MPFTEDEKMLKVNRKTDSKTVTRGDKKCSRQLLSSRDVDGYTVTLVVGPYAPKTHQRSRFYVTGCQVVFKTLISI